MATKFGQTVGNLKWFPTVLVPSELSVQLKASEQMEEDSTKNDSIPILTVSEQMEEDSTKNDSIPILTVSEQMEEDSTKNDSFPILTASEQMKEDSTTNDSIPILTASEQMEEDSMKNNSFPILMVPEQMEEDSTKNDSFPILMVSEQMEEDSMKNDSFPILMASEQMEEDSMNNDSFPILTLSEQMEEDSTKNEFGDVVGSSNPEKQEGSTPLQVVGDGDLMVSCDYEEPVVDALKIDLTHHFLTDQVFDTRDEMIAWCQDIGKRNNMVLVIAKSEKPIPGRKTRITLGCERGGVFRHHRKKDLAYFDLLKTNSVQTKKSKPRKHTGTKKCGCPFTLRGVWLPDDKWRVKVECGEHNHELANTLVGHSFAGRLKHNEKQLLKEMMNSGVKPKEVLTTLKQRSKGNRSTMRTIYNARAHMRLAEMEGRSEMQQVMKLLEEYHYVEWHLRDEDTDEVKDIFWSHPDSIQLAKSFPSVLMVDCTYKTNRYQMPLFEIIGVTSTGKTFTVGFVFMKAETEEHYTWALNQLKTIFEPNALPSVFVINRVNALINAINIVFPKADHLLCTFHISRNVLANCKDHFDNSEDFDSFLREWEELMQSETHVAFDEGFATFEHKWVSYPTCVQYIRDTWLGQMEHFVSAWTNKVKHYGNTTTKFVESAHAIMNRMLGSSQGTFVSCWTAMHSSITNEITTVKESLEESLTSVKHSHDLPVLKDLKNYVSHLALDMLVAEHSRGQCIDIDNSVCECALRFTHGLPCAHEIMQFEREGQPIPLSDIDPHWRRLSAVLAPIMPSNPDNLPEFDLFKRRWEISSETERRTMLRKLKEIVTPTMTTLQEPLKTDSVIC